jgi:hypothetical protein
MMAVPIFDLETRRKKESIGVQFLRGDGCFRGELSGHQGAQLPLCARGR